MGRNVTDHSGELSQVRSYLIDMGVATQYVEDIYKQCSRQPEHLVHAARPVDHARELTSKVLPLIIDYIFKDYVETPGGGRTSDVVDLVCPVLVGMGIPQGISEQCVMNTVALAIATISPFFPELYFGDNAVIDYAMVSYDTLMVTITKEI